MKYLIIGAGAIGTYIGGSLLRSGQPVIFVEREEVAARIRKNGLKIVLEEETFIANDIQVLPNFSEGIKDGVDIVIFAMKSFDTQSAIQMVKNHKDKYKAVLCLQNGVENEMDIAAALGDDYVVGGSVTSAIERLESGQAKLEKKRGIGIASGHPLAELIVVDFNVAGLNTRLYPAMMDMKWSKMLSNLLGNATSAILNMTPAEIFANPDTYKIEVLEMQEAVRLMRKLSLQVVNLPGVPMKLLIWIMLKLPKWISQPLLGRVMGAGRGNKMPSFHIDLHSGKKNLESGYLNGAISRFGHNARIATPVNDLLDRRLKAMVLNPQLISEYDHKACKLLKEIEETKLQKETR